MASLKTVDKGPMYLYVLDVPTEEPSPSGFQRAVVIPVLKRRHGVLLAMPVNFLLPAVLEAGALATGEEMIGPSYRVAVPAMVEEADGTEMDSGLEADVLLVDCDMSILVFMRELDPVTDSSDILFFLADSIDHLPQSQPLLAAGFEWLQVAQDARVQFYSAEGALFGTSKAVGSKESCCQKDVQCHFGRTASRCGKGDPCFILPAKDVAAGAAEDGQFALRFRSSCPSSSYKATVPDSPNAFSLSAGQGYGSPSSSQASSRTSSRRQCCLQFHPRTGASSASIRGRLYGRGPICQGTPHGRDPHAAVSGPHYAGGTLGESGWLRRSGRIIQLKLFDLIEGSGKERTPPSGSCAGFFCKVAQNAFRRIRPTEKVPGSLEEFRCSPVFAKYMERQGNFSGNRDMGLVMWLLSQMADQMLQGDVKGAQELLALTMVTVEQVAQDNGRWDVAWPLSLQEDPPPGVFQHRPVSQNPRLRAFAPLCPPDWAATALGFAKEVDIISSQGRSAATSQAGAKGRQSCGTCSSKEASEVHKETKSRRRRPGRTSVASKASTQHEQFHDLCSGMRSCQV